VVGVWVWRGVGLFGKVLQCHVMGVGFCFLVPSCGLILQSSAEGEVFCPESWWFSWIGSVDCGGGGSWWGMSGGLFGEPGGRVLWWCLLEC
jgi:hypothetical protein